MRFLRSNTAVLVTVGPFYDKTDGVTIETSLTITNERITLTADTDDGSAPTNILDNVTGATSGTSNDLNYITGNDAGMMQLELTAANTNRVGRMFLSITDAANHVPVFHEFFVLPQAIYDWVTGVIVPLPANVTTWLGTAAATPTVAGVPEVDITHAAGTAWGSGAITAGAIATGAIDADALAADAGTEIATAVWASTTRSLTILDEDSTTMDLDATIRGAVGLATANLDTQLDALPTNAELATALAAADDAVLAEIALVKAKTDNLPADPADASDIAGLIDALPTAAENADAVWEEALADHSGTIGSTAEALANAGAGGTPPSAAEIADAVWDEDATGHQTQGTFGQAIGDPGVDTDTLFALVNANLDAAVSSRSSQTSVDTIDDFLDTEVAAIKAKTDNLPSDPADASDISAAFSSVNSSLSTISGYVDSIESRLPATLVGGRMDASIGAIADDATCAANLQRSTAAIVRGTVAGGASTTSIPTSSLAPAVTVADQLKGRIVIFDKDTATAALRGQATDITASTDTGVLTVTALTDAPASGDTFTVT